MKCQWLNLYNLQFRWFFITRVFFPHFFLLCVRLCISLLQCVYRVELSTCTYAVSYLLFRVNFYRIQLITQEYFIHKILNCTHIHKCINVHNKITMNKTRKNVWRATHMRARSLCCWQFSMGFKEKIIYLLLLFFSRSLNRYSNAWQ